MSPRNQSRRGGDGFISNMVAILVAVVLLLLCIGLPALFFGWLITLAGAQFGCQVPLLGATLVWFILGVLLNQVRGKS